LLLHTLGGPKSYVTSCDMDTHIENFLEARVGHCVESWVELKGEPDSQHKSCDYFGMK
jgi:hypothetical protein